MKRSLLAVIIPATAAPTLAEPIDATTPCSVAIHAFGSAKRAGEVLAGAPSQEVLEVGNYILNIMDQLDRQRTNAGEQGIWSNFSDAGKHAIAGSAVANCRLHPRRTIHEAADAERIRKGIAELLALAPDIIVTTSTPPTTMFREATRTIPIVFGSIVDPVGSGLVESLSQPGGNVTGFTNYEYSIGPKWLELLKEIAPTIRNVGILRDPTNVAEIGMLGAIETAGPQFGVEFRPVDTRTVAEIERSIAAVARGGYGGLIITSGNGPAVTHRDRILALAATLKLPAVYSDRGFIPEGGLASYGPDRADQYRRVAGYVDRILKGEKPAELPVQAPTKFLTAINLKTAKALGIDVPHSLLARADEVIE